MTVETKPESPPAPPAPLAYAPSPNTVSVRGFRLLIALTLLNTTLLGSYVLGPAFNTYARQQWAAYQQRRADERAAAAEAARLQAMMVAEKVAMAYTAEPDEPVYDDNPARRDPPTTGSAAAPWPAVVPQPAAYQGLPKTLATGDGLVRPSQSVLFLHERRASDSSPARLVAVVAGAKNLLSPNQPGEADIRRIYAISLEPTTPARELALLKLAVYQWHPDFQNQGGESLAGASLRLFAGQADPDDPSRFVVPYEVAGVRGVLRGQLQADDSVRLTPEGPLQDRLRPW